MPAVESSAVRRIEYDAAARTLFVIFDDGDQYAYFGVGPELYEAFLAAESKGRFFQAQVRDRFVHHRIT
jgi:lysyl-tRNA synthetase class 2